MLFRHERLVSLPALPYHREFALAVRPLFDVEGMERKPFEAAQPAFARRKPALLAIRPARLSAPSGTTGNKVTYTFRLVLSQQGDFLTPEERMTACELDKADLLSVTSGLLSGTLAAADLPDLATQYQVLWRLPDDGNNGASIYASLVDVVLPGHPLWKPAAMTPDEFPVLVRNANGDEIARLKDDDGGQANTETDTGKRNYRLKVWRPSPNARPVFSVTFQVEVSFNDPDVDPNSQLFGNPDFAVLQVVRDGYLSRPLPMMRIIP